MSMQFSVGTILFESGERFPMVREDGVPLFYPTIFAVSALRARGRASGTIEAALRAVCLLLQFCKENDIDLMTRMREGRILTLGEIDALVRMCRLPVAEMHGDDFKISQPEKVRRVSREAYRQREKAKKIVEIGSHSIRVRLLYIREYIKWLANLQILSFGKENEVQRSDLECVRKLVCTGLTARMPAGRGRNSVNCREGLSENEQERVWRVVDAGGSQNPFKTTHTKNRNDLIVRWLMGLGIRRSELLGIKVSDINFRNNEVLIARRADDKTDDRIDEPNTKTYDRFLPISDDLARRTREYITDYRCQHSKARRHEFLFVANGGSALSKRGFNRIFEVLSESVPNFPHVFPHVFRHTNNGNFSVMADEQKMTEEVEKKIRSQMMGWSETSGTAATYTRREILRKARAASLDLQNKLMVPKE